MGAGTITQPRRHGTLFAGLAAIGLAWALAAADAPAVRAQPAGNPVAAVAPWFIDFQRGPAAIEVCRRQGGHRWQAARLAVIAAQPSFYWMGGWQAQGGSM